MAEKKLPLTRAQREKFFAGECPTIYGPRTVTRKVKVKDKHGNLLRIEEREATILRECPLEAGDVVKLSDRLRVEAIRVDGRKGGGWKLHYAVLDRRDPVRKIRRTPPVVVPEADDLVPDEDANHRAAVESSYTNYLGAVSGADEAVDELTQQRITRQAHEHASHQELVNQVRREKYELEQRLERAREDAILRGVDVSSPLRVIERQIAKIERRVYEGRAA